MNVEVWADIVCPWCYIGKRNLEEALALFAHREAVNLIWRSYELNPEAPPDAGGPVLDMLMENYNMTMEDAMVSQARVTAMGNAVGLEFHLELTRQENSFDAHRMVQLAGKFGLQGDMQERLMRAYFVEGRLISDRDTLIELVSEVGVDADEARDVLVSGAFSDDVRVFEQTATDLAVRGVPFFVVDRKYGVSGAQPTDVLLDVLQQAWDEKSA